jgi:L-gulonolactone oxidase
VPAFRNFAGNVRFEPRRVARPATVAELAAVVRESRRVRAVGAAHSWSPAIVTDDTLISLDRMTAPRAPADGRVTVQAGMTLRALNAHLERHGRALANLGSIDAQTVAGVIATGTHGTGRAFRCLAAQVARLDLIDGRGREVSLERGHPDFAGAVVGLGALGVVHAVTFDTVPAFRLRDATTVEAFDDVIARVDDVVASADHVKLWWFPPSARCVVFRNHRTDAPPRDNPVQRVLTDRVLGVAIYRSLVALGKLTRRRAVPAINEALTAMAGRPFGRTSRSHVGFLTPVPPPHAETEWAFDARDLGALLRDYRRVMTAGRDRYNFVQEIRLSRGDDLWLSPGYGRDSVWLSMYNIDARGWPAQLARFETFARAHGGRPHWGKDAAFDRAYLRGQYARLDDFAALAARYDPERKLRNAWLDSILDD